MPTKTKKSPLEKADPTKEISEKLNKLLELPVEVPNIEETVKVAEQAIAAAQKQKQKKLTKHLCTECGSGGIQLYHKKARAKGKEHFDCFINEEGQYCDEHGEPFTDPDKLEALRQVRERGTVK